MNAWEILQVFPSASVIQEERVPSDHQNDFNFVIQYVKDQLASDMPLNPNMRVKAALKMIHNTKIPLLDVLIDLVRLHITSLQLGSIEDFNVAFFSVSKKCDHLSTVALFDYQQSVLMQKACAATFQSLFLDAGLMNVVSTLFAEKLFTTRNDELIGITSLLRALWLTDRLEEIIINVTIDFVSRKVHHELAGKFDIDLGFLVTWSSEVLYPILEKFLYSNEFDQQLLFDVVRAEVVKLRTKEIFHMVSQFPRSTKALNDMRFSINSQAQREALVDSFIHSCNSKLLHAGSDTVTIIQHYMKTVRSFLVIEPRGVLLDKSCRPISKYLRMRDDTVDWIVDGLLNRDQTSMLRELSEELFNTKANCVEVDDINDPLWAPDPIDALPDFSKRKVGDLVESLLSIFDSRSVFFDVLVKRFAQDLSKLTNYDVREIETSANFLKARFGEDGFQSIDIMIQDIKESALMDKDICSAEFHASVVSHLFWPVEGLVSDYPVPPFLKNRVDGYEEEFKKVKKGRNLKPIPSLGTVELDLDFDNGERGTFSVSPIQATVIQFFSENRGASTDDIAMQLFIDPDDVAEIVGFWEAKHVLVLTDVANTYEVNESWTDKESL